MLLPPHTSVQDNSRPGRSAPSPTSSVDFGLKVLNLLPSAFNVPNSLYTSSSLPRLMLFSSQTGLIFCYPPHCMHHDYDGHLYEGEEIAIRCRSRLASDPNNATFSHRHRTKSAR